MRTKRAAVIVLAALALTSVVLWPLALLLLPALFWAATGGRVARWSAAVVAAVAVFVAAEMVVWLAAGDRRSGLSADRWWMVVVAVVVVPPTLAVFVRGSARVGDRRSVQAPVAVPS